MARSGGPPRPLFAVAILGLAAWQATFIGTLPAGSGRGPWKTPVRSAFKETKSKKTAERRRVWLKNDGLLYSVFVDQDVIGDDLRRAATPHFDDLERARVTLLRADGAELDLEEPVPADVGVNGASAAVVVPLVLHQLAGCVVKPAIEQYGKYLGHASTTLRDRQEALRVLAEAAVRSAEATADHPRHLVVFAGSSGAGKTRAGYEGSAMWKHADGQAALEEALKGAWGGVASKLRGLHGPAPANNVLTLYIDLHNGLPYHSGIDRLEANVRLGARFAARALGLGLDEMVQPLQQELSVENVLRAILRGRLAERSENAAPLLLVVHVDEWQLYMQRLAGAGRSIKDAVADVKAMFSALNSFAFNPPTELKGKFVLLPILSGTPVLGGVRLDMTERMQRLDGLLPPLSKDSAHEMAVEQFVKEGFPDELVRSMLKSIPARVGLGDTGGLPRLLLRLCDYAVQSAVANKKRGNDQPLWHIKWAESAQKASCGLPSADQVDRALPLLALTGQAIEMKGGSVETDITKAVRDADQRGLVQLEKAWGADQFVVKVPFMLLRLWCTGGDFPEELLQPVQRSWTWEEFEQLYAHFTAARLNAMLEISGGPPAVRALCEVIKGARGSEQLLAQQVRLRHARLVYREDGQFMPTKASQPEKVDRVLAARARGALAAEIDLHAGVFLATAGNYLFDMRYTLEAAADDQSAVHVFVQDRHTGTDTTVNTKAISAWYAEADNATRKWRVGERDSVALLYFTNRRLTDPKALNSTFFSDRPRLLVVTRDQLGDALTPAFVQRGLVPQNPRPT